MPQLGTHHARASPKLGRLWAEYLEATMGLNMSAGVSMLSTMIHLHVFPIL